MNIRDMVREVVAEMVASEVKNALADQLDSTDTDTDTDEPTKRTRKASKGSANRAIGPRVVYHLTKAGTRKSAGDALTGNNAKVFRIVAKHPGSTKRAIADRIGVQSHSTESNIYQLQQMGLIESRPTK